MEIKYSILYSILDGNGNKNMIYYFEIVIPHNIYILSNNIIYICTKVTSGQLIYAMLLQAVSARLFLIDRLMRYREFESSVLTVPYYLGKVVGNFVEYLLYSFAFNAG